MDPFNSKFILKEKRSLWIDYDKGISIILVGYGHCMEALNFHTPLNAYPSFTYFGVFFYGFRMPLFFIISGLLVGRSLNKKKLSGYIGDRTNNILYPLMIWGIIEVTLQLIALRFTNFTHNYVSPAFYLKIIIDPRQVGSFWYLNALFCIGVIYATLKSRFKITPVIQVIIGIILYAISAYIHVHGVGFNPGFLIDILEFYIFFALGDLISNIMLDEKNVKRLSSWKVFVPLLVVFAVIQYFFTEINLKPTPYSIRFVEVRMPLFFLLEALVGCATSVSFSFLLQKYKLFTWIRVIGYHSLFIYCMQGIVMVFARVFFQSFLHINYTPALILLVWTSGVLLPVFFYNFCLRYNLWWMFTFRKPDRQVEYLRTNNIFSWKRKKAILN